MDRTSLWGWESFFVLIERLIIESEQQKDTASDQYTNYVIEKLEMSMSNIRSLKIHIDSHVGTGSFQGDELAIIEQYKEDLDFLLTNLRPLLLEWRTRKDHQVRMDAQSAYQAPVLRSGRRGRPKYLITSEQLLHLISLEFSINDISVLLGKPYVPIS